MCYFLSSMLHLLEIMKGDARYCKKPFCIVDITSLPSICHLSKHWKRGLIHCRKMAQENSSASSAFDQLCFTGESSCSLFRPHFLKPDMCTSCMKEIGKHTRNAVDSEETVLRAVEQTQKGTMTPSLILETDPKTNKGGLFLGGFKSAINAEFLKKEKITHILNVAGKGLGIMFGLKYKEIVKTMRENLNITGLDLDWEDSMKYHITEDDFEQAVDFIAHGRNCGSVLVHCAQGKSRSGAAVSAYLMAAYEMKMIESIDFIQKKRKMVDPNPNFRILLIKFEKSEKLKKLTKQLVSASKGIE